MAFSHVGGFEAIYEDQIGHLVHHMDQWLDAIGRDKGNQTASIKVSRNKPRDLVDGCWTIDGHRITEERTYGGAGQCNQLYPPYGDPRIAAGGPIADDLLKCAVKPFDSNDYHQPLTTNQIDRLKKTFARGVCDYSKPGVEQGPIKGTWQTF
jgi:hypothetical protein